MRQVFPELGVNIDHVATLRNSREGFEPDPLSAAVLVKKAGAAQLVCHLREDRRHIRDSDLRLLRAWNGLPVNLEMAMTDEMASIALDVRPALVTLVPERREERTTEGGLVLGRDMCGKIGEFVKKCRDNAIRLSLFLAPDTMDMNRAIDLGVDQVELHTGEYANASDPSKRKRELERLFSAAARISESSVRLAAGHGLDRENLLSVLAIDNLMEVNIGHSIIARSLYVGLEKAVSEILERIRRETPLMRREGILS